MKALIINGPNLNVLGKREPGVYGSYTLEQINRELQTEAALLGLDVDTFQSNHEGEIVEKIQQARDVFQAIVINPGAYTHTSIAIRDALLYTGLPVIEVHLSNVAAREEFRRRSMISDIAVGTIAGFGRHSYILALKALSLMDKSK